AHRALVPVDALRRGVAPQLVCQPRSRHAWEPLMPVKEGPVPPFPPGADPDEYDRLRRRVLWRMPSGLYVVGTTDKGERRNGMTINFVTQLSFDPKLIGIGVEQEAFTHELLTAGGVFALCLIDRDDRAIVRKFTKPVDVDLDAHTLNGFPYLDG